MAVWVIHKWCHFDRAKTTFKILLASWTFDTVWKRFRSFNAENLGSVGQRVAKLLAIKLCACTLFGFYGQRVCKRHLPRFENTRGQIILKVWWPVTLQPFDLQTPNFQHWKIYLLFKLCRNCKGLAAFWGWVLPCQIDLIYIGVIK